MFNHTVVQECLTFLNDTPRNAWYREKLKKQVPGKVVMEIGCGAGILAAYALEFGAKKYYGIDIRSNRAHFTRDILKDLGYGERAQVWTDDFCQLTTRDLPQDIDILLCEQTGHQFQNNFTIKQFWQHANKVLNYPYNSLPDEWSIDAEIYEGLLDSQLPEYQPRVFIPDSVLPSKYYNAVRQTEFVKPSQYHASVFSICPLNSAQDISFTIDLRGYKSATVVLTDHISYGKDRCRTISATTDWPGPIKLVVPNADSIVEFIWDYELRCLPHYTKGYWRYQHVS